METLRLENVMKAFRNKSAQGSVIIVGAEWYMIKISPGSLDDIIIYRPRAIDSTRAISYDITSETGQYSYSISPVF